MEYNFMKARQGDVFEWRDKEEAERYSVADYDFSSVYAVKLGSSFLHKRIGIKVFSYEELQKERYELLNIR